MSKIKFIFLFGLSWFLWIFCFRHFLTGELALIGDATSYYDHIQFFIKNMAQGIYPIWDPYWNYGTPNEFFLRRIGSFNPLYSFLIVFVKIGIPFKYGYLYFFTAYWFLGCVGFYKLLKTLTQNTSAAFAGYCLLLYSSLGTRFIDSFILLEFVPMAWFFFFLARFIIKPRRSSCIGLSLTTLILMTTYIPFYFLTIFAIFLILGIIFYFKSIPNLLRRTGSFVMRHKWISLLCLITILASALPGIQMFEQTRNGSIVMPKRNTESADASVLAVKKQSFGGGGITALLSPYELISHLDEIELERFYVPFFALILFFIGWISSITRLQSLLVLWAALIFLIGLNNATPVYQFLYDNMFFFKYFRNSFFFLWIAILPILICLFSMQLVRYITTSSRDIESRYWLLGYSVLLHSLFFLHMTRQESVFLSTYISLGLSLAFFIFIGSVHRMKWSWLPCLFLLMIISIQPLETYWHLAKNSQQSLNAVRLYDDMKTHRIIDQKPYDRPVNVDLLKKSIHPLYIATPGYNDLYENINPKLLPYFSQNRFLAFDHISIIKDTKNSFNAIADVFHNHTNHAYIQKHPFQTMLSGLQEVKSSSSPKFEILTDTNSDFIIEKSTANSMVFTTHWDQDRFLVINDTVEKEWTSLLDGKNHPIFTTFHAFKGIFVPKGSHKIELNYGSTKAHRINGALLGLSYFLLILLIIFWNKERRTEEKNVD